MITEGKTDYILNIFISCFVYTQHKNGFVKMDL